MKWRILTKGGERVKRVPEIDRADCQSGYLREVTMVKRIVPIKLVSLTCSPV